MKLLVSACLLGQKVRYDGSDKGQNSALLNELITEDRVVTICPEVAGGLGVPRLPAEIQNGAGNGVLNEQARVLDSSGKDVTTEFVSGAQQALALAQAHNIRAAILKARSPSCGKAQIYDGTFGKRLIDGSGVTAALLERHGIKVFNEDEIAAALDYAAQLKNED
ncbi:MAG: DUF523 domain-containing protein [Acidobacteria bacterium]|nr:DUF523 domain-containing protein [Acidobacteriota bacterium]